jgi:hypothetical protein
MKLLRNVVTILIIILLTDSFCRHLKARAKAKAKGGEFIESFATAIDTITDFSKWDRKSEIRTNDYKLLIALGVGYKTLIDKVDLENLNKWSNEEWKMETELPNLYSEFSNGLEKILALFNAEETGEEREETNSLTKLENLKINKRNLLKKVLSYLLLV